MLTTEEWGDGEVESHYCTATTSLHVDHKGRLFATSDDDVVVLNEAADAPAVMPKVAALCLHAVGYFTWEDVDTLKTEASVLTEGEDADPFTYQTAGVLSDLAARIAALLPPEQP